MNVFVIIDGLGDLPNPELCNKTPLQAARIPALNWFAMHGKNGHVYSIREGVAPESDGAVIALMGYDAEKVYTGRGPLEALGAGLAFTEGSIVFRTNFATVDGRKVVDRRAGRGLTTKEAKVLEREINKKVKLSVPFVYKSTVQHRGVLELKGRFSDAVSNVDPAYMRLGKIGVARAAATNDLPLCEPLDDTPLAKRSANIVNEFVVKAIDVLDKSTLNQERRAKGLLAANALLLRDSGVRLPNLTQKKGWAAVVSMPLEMGVAMRCGMRVIKFKYPEMKTLDVFTNLWEGLRKAVRESRKAVQNGKYSAYYIHFKEIDVCGHDGNYKEKIKMLEFLDKEFFMPLRKMKKFELIVVGDHSTPCIKKSHTADPVPLLLYKTGARGDGIGGFNEAECRKGSLGKMYGKDVMEICGFG